MAKKTTTKKTSSKKPASKTAAKQPASKKTTSKKPATKRPTRARAAKPAPTPKTTPVTPQSPGTPATGPSTPPPRRMTCLDAAHAVLVRLNKPMRVRDLMEQMIDRELWSSPAGLTPESTLAAAIGRDISKRGAESRFQRVDRGFFAAREWEG